MNQEFKPGDVVVFDPEIFDKTFWSNLPEEKKIRYYGRLGYGQKEFKRFVFLCEINQAPGHCVLASLDDQKIETMRHMDVFRLVTEEEM